MAILKMSDECKHYKKKGFIYTAPLPISSWGLERETLCYFVLKKTRVVAHNISYLSASKSKYMVIALFSSLRSPEGVFISY